jgi:hypothetical protein
VHLTQIDGGKVTQIADLCPECAQANGVDATAPLDPKAVSSLLRPAKTGS